MPTTKFLARDLTLEIQDPASGGGWVEILGVETASHSPSTTVADTTDFASQGHKEGLVAERGDEWSLAGFHLEDVVTGARDPGQALVEALAQAISTNSHGAFRITSPGGNSISFTAMAEVNLHGGGHNDAATWGCKLTVTGAMIFA